MAQAAVGDTLFFSIDVDVPDVLRGHTELWKSDGTAAGTVMVKTWASRTFCASPHPTVVGSVASSGRPQEAGHSLHAVGDTLFFAADDGTHGRELWKSDGTEAGTVMVKDINPSLVAGETSEQGRVRDGLYKPPRYPTCEKTDLVAVGDTAYFWATDGMHGLELWKSDGSEAGTVMVKDIVEGRVTDTFTKSWGGSEYTWDRSFIGSAFGAGTEDSYLVHRGVGAHQMMAVENTLY